ncbi:MAG: VWA domain-containing protein [Spirochaetales bacterium]|nr:VWA domain-containing protein [Spirochaetales bacterium]
MNVENPFYLLLLLILIPVAAAAVWNYRQGRVSRGRLTGDTEGGGAGANDVFNRFFVKTFLSTLFFCAFLVLALLALADISWGTSPEPEDRSGLDVVIAVDVSRSMLAQDSPAQRLRTAADICLGLMQGLPRCRFAVVVFRGAALLAVPMTEDRQILESFFQNISPSVAGSAGTSVESGLDLALEAFPAGTASHKAIVLLSDGESLAGFPGASAEKAETLGIPVFTVGTGAAEGSVIRLADGSLLTGKDGRPVVTRLNENALRAIAGLSRGEYFSSREPGVTSRLAQKLLDFEESRGKMGFRLVSVHRYRGFLFAGFLLLCAAVLVRSIKWRKN